MLSLFCCLPGFSSIPASRVCKQVVWIQPGTYTSTYLLVDVHYLTFHSGYRKLILLLCWRICLVLSDLFHIFSEGNQICMKAMNTLLDCAAPNKI